MYVRHFLQFYHYKDYHRFGGGGGGGGCFWLCEDLGSFLYYHGNCDPVSNHAPSLPSCTKDKAEESYHGNIKDVLNNAQVNCNHAATLSPGEDGGLKQVLTFLQPPTVWGKNNQVYII